jgi:chromosomal replication initiator protein
MITDLTINTWDRIKNQISSKISAHAFNNWLSRTAFLASEGDRLRVAVPDAATRDWIQEEYSAEIWSAVRDLNLSLREVVYEIQGSVQPGGATGFADKNEIVFSPSITLNPRFTFDSFVVGSCNQFANAAARAVVTNPSRTYNPLFIYGGVGMGKTHLMHAIGKSMADQHAGMRIIYTSSERFMNEMIACIKNDRMQLFQRHYRSADALLVDDIQILAGKERTMEEFFHTFNELFEHQKQIVISSDMPPKNTPGLVERLRSRFEWGLMVDVQPPDLETKMAILDKKAEAEGITLPEEVRIFIATKTKSNVRELEGALVKLMAYSSVTGSPISLPMAQQVLKHLTVGQERRISIESIVKAVAEKFSLQPSQLKQKTNEQKIVLPRQIAMYLAKELTSASLPEIGRAFGGKHHTTVLHSINKIDQLRQRDQDLNSLIHRLVDSIH